jgi:hypothetical protein
MKSLTIPEALSPLASDLVDPYGIPGGQTAFDALVEVRKVSRDNGVWKSERSP